MNLLAWFGTNGGSRSDIRVNLFDETDSTKGTEWLSNTWHTNPDRSVLEVVGQL